MHFASLLASFLPSISLVNNLFVISGDPSPAPPASSTSDDRCSTSDLRTLFSGIRGGHMTKDEPDRSSLEILAELLEGLALSPCVFRSVVYKTDNAIFATKIGESGSMSKNEGTREDRSPRVQKDKDTESLRYFWASGCSHA